MIEDAWVEEELAHWVGSGLDAGAVEAEAYRAVREEYPVFAFRIEGGRVETVDKTNPLPHSPHHVEMFGSLVARAEWYRAFIEDALARYGCGHRGVIAMDMDDIHDHQPGHPVFAFQRRVGTHRPLLPDLDFFVADFYAAPRYRDPIPFLAKQPRGVFAGSTTGNLPLTQAHVDGLTNERLRVAVFFRDREEADVTLINIVQTDNEQTSASIAALGVGGPPRDWRYQYGYRYLLSMDGNGATCSRVYLSLRSDAVLVKYRSNYELHYFRALEPGRHYLDAETDEDVVRHIHAGRADPAAHAAVALASRRFAERHLSRSSLMRYTARLIDAYLARFGAPDPAGPAGDASQRIDLHAAIAGTTGCWRGRDGWAAHPDGRPLCGLSLQPDGAIDPEDLRFAVADDVGDFGPAVAGHDFAAVAGERAMHGLSLMIDGRLDTVTAVECTLRHADGSESRVAPGASHAWRPSPVVAARIDTHDRRRPRP